MTNITSTNLNVLFRFFFINGILKNVKKKKIIKMNFKKWVASLFIKNLFCLPICNNFLILLCKINFSKIFNIVNFFLFSLCREV